ncbi:hypothetical protein NB689_003250 [Xanthomonas sacchari]|nr:hypothetical protein [Xanthomonas sacchari]
MARTGPASLQRRQTFADRVARQLRDALHAQLEHDVLAVGADGLDADVQARGDLLGRQPLGQQLHDLAFARGQQRVGGDGIAGRTAILADQRLRQLRTDVQLVVADLLDRAQQFVEGAVARQVALGAGVDGCAHIGRRIGGGDADRFAARAALQQPAGGLDAVEARQHHVHQHDIRLPSGHQLHALQSVDRVADHVDVRRVVEQGHHALQHNAAFGGNDDTCVHSLPVLAMELPTRDRAATRVPLQRDAPLFQSMRQR